jgi:N-methylhydantoinase B/oxoprolinase/acetone carboxylase alpha subunit
MWSQPGQTGGSSSYIRIKKKIQGDGVQIQTGDRLVIKTPGGGWGKSVNEKYNGGISIVVNKPDFFPT